MVSSAMAAPSIYPSLVLGKFKCRASSSPSAASTSVQWGCDSSTELQSGIALQKWLTKQGLPLQKVELRNVGAGGRGLVSTKMLYKGDRLLFIPTSLTMTTDSAWTCSEVAKLLKDKELPDWPLLACYLISEASLGKKSPWYHYIAALPRHPGSILEWSVADVETHLSATSIKDRSVQCIQEVENTFNDLNEELFSKHTAKFSPEVYNMDSFKWAFGILFSRLVRLPSLKQQLALVPFGDMLNHSTEVSTFLDFDSPSKSIACTLDRGYEPNKEVFISYGKRSNAELLMAYGFVPSGRNPDDSVNLRFALDPADELYDAKLAALKQHNLSPQQVFPIRLNGWPVQLTAFACLLTGTRSQLNQYSKYASAATENEGNKLFVMESQEQVKAYELILSTCEKSIAACTSYLQNTDVQKGSSLSKLAAELCQSELKILYRNQYILRSELKDLRSGKSKSMFEKVGGLFRRS